VTAPTMASGAGSPAPGSPTAAAAAASCGRGSWGSARPGVDTSRSPRSHVTGGAEEVGLFPIATSQHSSTVLYQVSYHIYPLFFWDGRRTAATSWSVGAASDSPSPWQPCFTRLSARAAPGPVARRGPEGKLLRVDSKIRKLTQQFD
jgi:hypothetical protein